MHADTTWTVNTFITLDDCKAWSEYESVTQPATYQVAL